MTCPPAGRRLIQPFVEKRLMVKDTRNGHTVVEVALESLLRQWDDLASWLRMERQSLIAAEDVERSASAWQSRDRDPGWLLTGSRLTDAETLSATPGFSGQLAKTRDYLAASRHAENQRIQKEEEHRQAELRHAQERRQTAEAHASDLRKRARVLGAVLAGMAIVVLVIAGAGHAIIGRGLYRDMDDALRARARVMIDSGALATDPGKAVEGTAFSDVNAMLVSPGRAIYTADQKGQTLPLGQPEKDVIAGKLLLSLRSEDHYRVLAVRLTNGSSLLIAKSMAPTEKLLRQLDIASLIIGAIGVAIAAVASTVVTRPRKAAHSRSPDGA